MQFKVWKLLLAVLIVGCVGIAQRATAEPAQMEESDTVTKERSPIEVVQNSETSLEPETAVDRSFQVIRSEYENLTPSPFPRREGEKSKPLSLQERGLERGLRVVDSFETRYEPISQPDESSLVVEPVMGQVTSVSQLADVQPSDWAYQALLSLVEQYGCIAGYPDQTYRGNRSLSRYEFAAGLNACLARLTEVTVSATSNLVTQDDLATLRRLQEEFATELTTLRDRVEGLETRTATLEERQFSTTTTLRGDVWFNLTQAFPYGDILAERNPNVPNSAFAPPIRDVNNRPTRVEREQPEATLSYYAFLTLTTSFTGKDSLVTQLAVGNGNSPANQLVSAGFFNSWGTPFLDQTGTPTTGDVVLRELFYSFPVGEDIQVSVGPRLNYYRYFDANRFTFFLNGATSFNSNGSTLLNAIDRGSGAVVNWAIAKPLKLTVGYLAENTEFLNPAIFNTSSNPNDGLFNSSNTISTQLEYSPSSNFNLRLIYARSSLKPYNGFIGGAVGEPLPYGYADDGFGGQLRDSGADTFVANFDWLITDGLGVFGRYSYGRLDINPVNPDRSEGEIRVQAFQLGLGFPNLGKEGALGVISFVVPHDYLEGRQFLLAGGGDGGTQYELEVSYRYPINNNISIVPAFYTIWNPNNFESNPTVYVGNIRTQFSF